MNCDLCGANGSTYPTMIEGVTIQACVRCSQHGERVSAKPKPSVENSTKPYSRRRNINIPQSEEYVVTHYAQVIHQARERQKLSQKELASRLGIKESLLHKIESGHFEPPIDLATKMQKVMGIVLLERVSGGGSYDSEESHPSGPITVGDMIKIRKR